MRDSIEEELRFLSYLENIKFIKGALSVWDNFWQLKALQKLWKMLFISTQKLFSYSSFYLNFLVTYRNGLIKTISLITNNCNTHILQYLEK